MQDQAALITEREAATLVGLSVTTLQTWRCRCPERGPRYLRLGRAIRYRVADLRAWVDSCAAGGAA